MIELNAITRLIVDQGQLDEVGFKGLLADSDVWQFFGAGAIVMALDTHRVLLPRRAPGTPNGGLWSTWGGYLDAFEFPKQAMLRKLHEQTGLPGGSPFEGGHTNGAPGMYPLMTFHDMSERFMYYNFLTVIDSEFEPVLNEEMDQYGWFILGEWPSPSDPNLQFLLADKLTADTLAFRSNKLV